MYTMKGEKIEKRSSFGSVMRKKLSDVTNTLPPCKSPVITEKSTQESASVKELIDNLVKEKMALVKLIQEKNKILEMSGNEIQNLRTCLQKTQLQNRNLAQSNSHMLAELNLGRETIKTLQHEVASQKALLKTKSLELKGIEKENVQKNELQEFEMVRDSGFSMDSNARRRRGRPAKSRSLGSSTASQQNAEKEAGQTKRRCLRRQSSSWTVVEPPDDLFEIDEVKFPIVSPKITVKVESRNQFLDENDNDDDSFESEFEVEGSRRRVSIGRPLRRAAVKVQTYKEVPLNIKMRRSE